MIQEIFNYFIWEQICFDLVYKMVDESGWIID